MQVQGAAWWDAAAAPTQVAAAASAVPLLPGSRVRVDDAANGTHTRTCNGFLRALAHTVNKPDATSSQSTSCAPMPRALRLGAGEPGDTVKCGACSAAGRLGPTSGDLMAEGHDTSKRFRQVQCFHAYTSTSWTHDQVSLAMLVVSVSLWVNSTSGQLSILA